MLAGHFIPSTRGQIFLTQFGEFTSRQAILCLPSITEEMNLARAIVAGQADYFASHGLPVLMVDYFGTGDSQGEFNQATTNDWRDDIINAGQWLMAQGVETIHLWGIRFGSLLALHFIDEITQALPIKCQLHWKPVTSGRVFAGQFIRIKQASSMMQSGEKINWRERILANEEVEIAGYPLTKAMLESIEALKVSEQFNPNGFIDWRELASSTVTPAAKKTALNWPKDKFQINAFNCPAFWQIPEHFKNPELYHSHADFVSRVS